MQSVNESGKLPEKYWFSDEDAEWYEDTPSYVVSSGEDSPEECLLLQKPQLPAVQSPALHQEWQADVRLR